MLVLSVLLAVLAGSSRSSLTSRLSSQSGLVLSPASPGYEERRKVMNAACTAQPAVIVVPNTERDISVLLEVAREEGLEVSVRSGGHSYTCTNIKEGGLHIDLRNFNKLELVRTDQSDTGLALKLGPGRIWGDVLDFAPPERYSYPHGQCRSVGVGGYLLGGGVNWLGSYNKYGYGAEHVLAMRVVLATGEIGLVDSEATRIEFPTTRYIPHAGNNNLFTALRGAGSSLAVVTEFLYMIYETPEADPAVLLAWIETKEDLETIHRAAKSTNKYSITISQEFANQFWKKELTQIVYELYPGIMNTLKAINFKSSYPVPLTVTDIRPTAGHKTDPDEASDYLKSQGVRMVFALDFTTNIFHDFAEYLYGNNMQEQQNWEPGKYFLSSLNFGGLANSDSFQDIFFNDPSFGVRRSDFLEFASHGCDYCFWMIHYRNRQGQTSLAREVPISTNTELDKPDSLDTNIVCMFTNGSADCPHIIKRVKERIETNLRSTGLEYSKYANFPSCSESDWGPRYWDNYARLQTVKKYWDPANTFNHCHSVGSSNNTCCPDYDSNQYNNNNNNKQTCTATNGKRCVFPFSYMMREYESCTVSLGGRPWCATEVGIIGAMRRWGYCDTDTCPVA